MTKPLQPPWRAREKLPKTAPSCRMGFFSELVSYSASMSAGTEILRLRLRMTVGREGKSRNADFILIAEGDTFPSEPFEPSEPGPLRGPFNREIKKFLDKSLFIVYPIICNRCRDVAQFGRALPWGGRGRMFESCRSDHFFYFNTFINFYLLRKVRPFL